MLETTLLSILIVLLMPLVGVLLLVICDLWHKFTKWCDEKYPMWPTVAYMAVTTAVAFAYFVVVMSK